jgi:hypothetical protein
MQMLGAGESKQDSAPRQQRQAPAPAGNDVPPFDPDQDIPFRQFRHRTYF